MSLSSAAQVITASPPMIPTPGSLSSNLGVAEEWCNVGPVSHVMWTLVYKPTKSYRLAPHCSNNMYIYINPTSYNNDWEKRYLVGAFFALPLWKMMEWVRQLGWLFHSQYDGKIIQMFQTTNQIWKKGGSFHEKITGKSPILRFIVGKTPSNTMMDFLACHVWWYRRVWLFTAGFPECSMHKLLACIP